MRAFLYGKTFPRLWQDMRENPGKWWSRLAWLLGPWFAFLMVERLNENNLVEDFQPWQVLFNLVWYYILFFLCRLALGRRRRSGALAICLCFVVGLVNHYVLRFRGRILFPADVTAWRTAANVAGGFDFSMDYFMGEALILLLSYLFLLWACPAQKKRDRFPVPAVAALVAATGIYTYSFFFTGMLPALGIYTQQWVTQANGFLLNFTVALRYSTVERPEGYSQQSVRELMDRFPALEGEEDAVRPVNIIAIMNESFSDLTVFDTFAPSSDPTPFLHSLEENTIQGWMYSPVTGGGTATVEFEYLTGFSTSFHPPHTVAYQLYMEEDMPSLAQVLGQLGYRSTAFHPYQSSGWNRPIAYADLGFDVQLYQEDVPDPYYIRSYISDRSSYETVRSTVQAWEGDSFVFNVTMQNHSGYAQGWRNLPLTVTLAEDQNEADPSTRQYLSLVRASDKALKELIEYYQGVEEPTLIVFFGDHQPPLTNRFYETLYGKSLNQRTTQELLQQYIVPFFLWANYDIPEQKDVILSPNFLGVLTAQTAGLPMTGWMNFLSQLYEQLPVITPVGYVAADGAVTARSGELTQEQQQWLHWYEMLCYCGLMDLEDETRAFFQLAQ